MGNRETRGTRERKTTDGYRETQIKQKETKGTKTMNHGSHGWHGWGEGSRKPLTPALSRGERENRIQRFLQSRRTDILNRLDWSSPLPLGEGQGEGRRNHGNETLPINHRIHGNGIESSRLLNGNVLLHIRAIRGSLFSLSVSVYSVYSVVNNF